MTKNRKIFLGIVTVLPIAMIFLFIVFSFLFAFGMIYWEESGGHHRGDPSLAVMFGSMGLFFLLMGVMMIAYIGTLIYYVIHASNNPKLVDNNKLMWILIIIFGGIISNCIYWYLHIWKEPKEEAVVKPNT